MPVEGYTHPEGRWYTTNAWGKNSVRAGVTTASSEEHKEYFKPMWRWSEALQNDFASRADWCVSSYRKANHPPKVRLAHAADLKAKQGETLNLSASGSSDPDGDELSYHWWQYGEADSYEGIIDIPQAGEQDMAFMVPADAEGGQTIHIICEVKDKGSPALTRYQRIVIEIE